MKIVPPEQPSQDSLPPKSNFPGSLADWLAAQGHRLNTRCGGRGLCRGCEVRIEWGGQPETVRACRLQPSHPIETLWIPHESYADQSLSGVSAFDIHLPKDAPPVRASGLGLALDIGTTTLAGALWDIARNRCLATATAANPQRRFGDNVLSRISYSLEKKAGLVDLQRCLIDEGLNPLIAKLIETADLPENKISCVHIAGNPTLLQSLTGDSLEGLSRYPFKLAFEGERVVHASSVGFALDCDLQLLPALGPFVGADIVAGAIASGMLDDARSTLLIDFGTNGELLLRHAGKTYATATAAGPAFEGGRLSCGTTARPDSISSLELSHGRWLARCGKGELGNKLRGLSGAAYIDFLALAVEAGLLSLFGRFDRSHPLWIDSGIVDDESSRLQIHRQTHITEGDIAELLQAKAAIGAGIHVLLEQAGINAAQLERVLVAGGFGYYLNPHHAMRVGLLPNVPQDRIETIGNASLAGASLSLQYDLSRKINTLRQQCRIIELNQIPSFSEYYTDAMALEPVD